MKKLFFILLSVFVINLEIYGENILIKLEEDQSISGTLFDITQKKIIINSDEEIHTDNCKTENINLNNSITLNTENFDYNIQYPCIKLDIPEKPTKKIQYNVNIDNASLSKTVIFKYKYTCADGYTNQYYPNAQDTYKQEPPLPQKLPYDKGCFKYVRYCSDLTKPKNCGITGITETLTDKQIYQQGDKHILLVQDTNLTVKNLKWCDSDGVGSNVKCGTGGG